MSAKKRKASKVSKLSSGYGLELREIRPLNKTQESVFEYFYENHLVLNGLAGTGKTFLAMFLALREVLEYNNYKNIVIVRSAVQTRDIGFMPGDEQEKMSFYERPYADIARDLCNRGDAYDILKNRGVVEFMSSSFIRGITLDNTIVIVDEMQNMTFQELDSIATRLGRNSKIVFCGDYNQSDLKKDREKQGVLDFLRVMEKIPQVETVRFSEQDIVRSGFVRDYIIQKNELGIS